MMSLVCGMAATYFQDCLFIFPFSSNPIIAIGLY